VHPEDSGSSPDLIRRAQRGDDVAINELVKRWRGYVASICRDYLRDPGDVEDAIQDTLVKLIVHLDRVDARKPLAPYLAQIARRVCIDAIRRGAGTRGFAPQAPSTPEGDPPERDPPAGIRADPSLPPQVAETHAALADCLDRLSPDKRLLLVLHYGHEIKQKDLAAHWPERLPLWRSKQTLSLWMQQAREALHRCLEAKGVDGDAAGVFLDWHRGGS